ncbi:MAG TPA: hypothetical protein VMF70_13680 [Gemmatimonadales bacterium]|nr:hypothetical protein [Gemmatimonadales bacterium]
MDNGTLALLIPVLALAIPIVAIVSNRLVKLQQLRIEEAKVRAGTGDGAAPESLSDEVAQLRQELADVQERLDFAERTLAQVRNRPPLAAGPEKQK